MWYENYYIALVACMHVCKWSCWIRLDQHLNYETTGKRKCNQTKSILYSRGTLDIARMFCTYYALTRQFLHGGDIYTQLLI